MQYLCVGTNVIYQDLFCNVTSGRGAKPKGGIWATRYTNSYYNEWIEFFKTHPSALFYNHPTDPFNLPAVVITLKENSNIFIIDSKEKLDYLKKKYPTSTNWIDYTALAQDYDAIYLDIQTALSLSDTNERNNIWSYGVSSLIITNLDCIANYKQAQVQIEPYDYEFDSMQSYKIVIDEQERQVEAFKHPEILTTLENNYNDEDTTAIDEYLKQYNLEREIEKLLVRKAFNQS